VATKEAKYFRYSDVLGVSQERSWTDSELNGGETASGP